MDTPGPAGGGGSGTAPAAAGGGAVTPPAAGAGAGGCGVGARRGAPAAHTTADELVSLLAALTPASLADPARMLPGTHDGAEEWRLVWEARAAAARVHGALTQVGLTNALCPRRRVWAVGPAWFVQDGLTTGKLKKSHVTGLLATAAEAGVTHVVLLLPSTVLFNHHCRDAVRAVQRRGVSPHSDADQGIPPTPFPVAVEAIATGALPDLLPMHKLVPRIVPVDPEELPGVLHAMGQLDVTRPDERALPRMLRSADAQALWNGWPDGTVVQYMRRLGNGTQATVQTRCIVDEPLPISRGSSRSTGRAAPAWSLVTPHSDAAALTGTPG